MSYLKSVKGIAADTRHRNLDYCQKFI